MALQAAKSYRQALGWMLERSYANEEEESQGEALNLTLYLDLALVYLKQNKPKRTCISCRDALQINPNNPKAYYRMGLAQEKLGDLQAAQKSLLKAQKIVPDDPSVARALIAVSFKSGYFITLHINFFFLVGK